MKGKFPLALLAFGQVVLLLVIIASHSALRSRLPRQQQQAQTNTNAAVPNPTTAPDSTQNPSITPPKGDAAANKPYQWNEWFAPQVLSNIGLIAVAVWAGCIALRTLKSIERQTKANIKEARAGVMAAKAAKAANEQLKILNKQWLGTSAWKCYELPFPPPRVPTHLGISFFITNSTPLLLTLERVKFHVLGFDSTEIWINAPLGPNERYKIEVSAAELNKDQQRRFIQGGAQLQIVGRIYFANAFNDPDSSLFGRIIWRRGGKTRSMGYRGGLASRWQSAEDREEADKKEGKG